MLRILPLADDLILPQARQEIYFFNRIDPMRSSSSLPRKGVKNSPPIQM
jgi:hypothetical protein